MEFTDIFKFDKFIAPTLIKIVYWIGLGLILLGTLAGIAGTSYFSSYMGGSSFNLGGALIALIIGAFGVLMWRVVCELWIVTFSINERLGTLVDLKKAETGK